MFFSPRHITIIYKKTILGLFLCILFTNSLAESWIKAYNDKTKPAYGFATLVLSDDQLVFGGHNSNEEVIIFKTDANGTIKNSKVFSNIRFIKTIIETQDKNIFVCGITDSTEEQGHNIFWMKLDLNLNVIWSNQNSRAFNDIVESAIQHSNGSFYLVGYGSRTGNALSDRDAIVYHINGDGDIVNTKISNSFGTDYFNTLAELPGGEVVIAGTKLWQVAMDFYVVKYNTDLSVVTSRTFGGIDNDGAYDMCVTNGGIYILGGTYSFGAGKFDAMLTKLDFDLNIEFNKTYGQGSDEYPTSLIALDNELIIAGNLDTLNRADSTYVPIKSFFIRTNMDGEIINSKILSIQSIINSINAINATSKNEIVGVFSSGQFNALKSTSIVIFKTDSFTFKCCSFFEDKLFVEKSVVVSTRTQTFSYNAAGTSKKVETAPVNFPLDISKNCGPLDDSANIQIENRAYCIAEIVKIKAQNSVPPLGFTWMMGDSLNSTNDSLTFRFDTAGTYTIYYIANYDCNSDTDSLHITIVSEIPYEVFLNKTGKCIGKPISFRVDSTTSFIMKYKWDFGVSTLSNDTSNLESPTYTYTQAGTYNVKLTTVTLCGTRIDSITIIIPPLEFVSIEQNAITYCKSSTVPFELNSANTPKSVSWNFGDIGSSTNTSTNVSTTHIYNKPGNYVCTLISQFECNSDTDTLHIYIVDYFPVDAKISYDGFCSSDPFVFNVNSTLLNPNYTWDIRGPSSASYYTQTFSHTFSIGGRYTVYSSVSDNNCNLGLDTLVIDVVTFEASSINATNDPCLNGTLFSAANDPEVVLWKLSDGYTSNQKIFNYTFESTGDYEITLITNPNTPCADSSMKSIYFLKENADAGIYFPEVISPNDDGKNDLFYIENNTNNPCKIIGLRIFDRWGKIMHSVDKFGSFTWDGKYNGTAVIPGAYIAFLETELYTKSFVIHVVY